MMNSKTIPLLEQLAKKMHTDHLRDLFERDPQRFKNFSVRAEGILLDYSCLLYTSPSPRDRQKSRMPSSA